MSANANPNDPGIEVKPHVTFNPESGSIETSAYAIIDRGVEVLITLPPGLCAMRAIAFAVGEAYRLGKQK